MREVEEMRDVLTLLHDATVRDVRPHWLVDDDIELLIARRGRLTGERMG